MNSPHLKATEALTTRKFTFDEFMDGLAWWLVGPEGRSGDLDASMYVELGNAFRAAPFSVTYWQKVLTAAQMIRRSVPHSVSDILTNFSTQRLAAAGDEIVPAVEQALTAMIAKSLWFPDVAIEEVATLHHVLAQTGATEDPFDPALLCHLVSPLTFPATDHVRGSLREPGEYINYLHRVQEDWRATPRALIEQLHGVVYGLMLRGLVDGCGDNVLPTYMKVAQIVEIGRAHAGFFAANVNAPLTFEGFGSTLGELGLIVATSISQGSSPEVIDEVTYQRYAVGSPFGLDLRRSFRHVPTETDPTLRTSLLTAVNFLEGVAMWLYRAGAPQDFLLQSYQRISLFNTEGHILSERHAQEIVRALEKVRPFVSVDLDSDAVLADLTMHRAHLYGEYLRSVAPYQLKGLQWTGHTAEDDGAKFLSLVRELPSVNSDVDASWICHFVCPALFTPLPYGGEHYLGVDSYQGFNAVSRNLTEWSIEAGDDPYIKALAVLQYVSSGTSLINMSNEASFRAWPLHRLTVFLSILGQSHPGISEALRAQGTSPLESLHHATTDFQSSMMFLEGIYHQNQGWTSSGLSTILDSLEFKDGHPVIGRFVVPTELFPPGHAKIVWVNRKNQDSISIPVRTIDAQAIGANFRKEGEVSSGKG